nr:hypothetical protein [Tanacetum cinerariifolium]
MQRKKNDVNARTTLLLSLPDEHQKWKKNLLKQQYGNFKAEGSETLEQTFNRLQVIVSQLQFMDVEVKKDDLNQKFLTSLAPEWLMHTIVWRNRNDLDTISLDDLYNHLKVYAAETSSGRRLERIIAYRDQMWQDLTNQKLSVSTVTRWVISQESAEHLEVRKEEGKKTIDRGEDHALVADAEAPTKLALMANTKSKVFDNSLCSNDCKKNNDSLNSKIKDLTELEELKLEKDGLDGKLAGLLKASKNLDNLIESQRENLSWTGLPEFVDDTVTDYSRPSSTIASTLAEGQNKDSSTSEDVASPNTPKPFVKFVKSKDTQSENKTDKQETPKKPQVKYAEQYRHSNKKPNIKGNQRNWNNLKSYQLGPEFVLNKKACFNCGDFSHLANDCRKRVERDTT